MTGENWKRNYRADLHASDLAGDGTAPRLRDRCFRLYESLRKRLINMRSQFLPAIAIIQMAVIVCLAIALVQKPFQGDFLSKEAYAALSSQQTIWPEEKRPFAAQNSWYLEREALFMAFRSGPVELCCLGDSITQKFEWQDAFPDRRVANRGIGSDTTEGILARLDSVIALEPAYISLLAGANDLATGRTPDEIAVTYRQILEQLRSQLPGTKIVVSSMFPVAEAHPLQPEDILAVNEQLSALCEELDITFLDMFQAFSDESGHLRPEYALDNIHLSPAGFALWLSYLTPALER